MHGGVAAWNDPKGSMRILIVNTLYPPSSVGGAERSVALLGRAVAARGHDVHVASLHDGNATLEEQDGLVTVHRLPLRNLYWPFRPDHRPSKPARLLWHLRDRRNRRATRDLIALAKRIKPDVLHTNNLQGFSTEIWHWARANDIRIVHTLRDYSLMCARAALYRDRKDCVERCGDCRLLTDRKKHNTPLVDAVASNSRYVIDTHERHGFFRDTPSRVIFNIADVTSVVSSAERPGREDAPGLVFGVIGRVEPEKGIEVVLTALTGVEGDWRLRIAGGGQTDYIEGLKARYPDPRIDWMGFVKADAFYDSIDVLIIGSTWPEPLPRTMIESLARGTPTLYSDAGGTPEIGPMAPLAEMYAKDDPEALATQIRRALADPVAWRARRSADPALLEQFSEGAVAGRYIALYSGDTGDMAS